MSQTCKIDLRDMVKSLKGISKKDSQKPVRSIEAAEIVDLFAEQVRFLRSENTRLSTIVPMLLDKINIPESNPIHRGGLAIARLTEQVGDQDQPTYHNECHVIEVVIAAYCLGKREHLREDRLGELIVAAASHDLGHTGGNNSKPYELESLAYATTHPILQEAGWTEEQLDRCWQMIAGTDFRNGVQQVRASYRHTRSLPADNETRLLATQCLLLTEADVLFSCFDADYNDLLSKLLSAEWNRPGHNLSLKERIGFLTFVEFISEASVQLGLEERRKALIEHLTRTLEESLG